MTATLVVDDSTFMRNHLKDILTDNKLTTKIIECTNGLDAVRSYMKYKPDIVTMDFDMPEFNGIKATKEILHYDKNAKVMMISSKEEENMADIAMKNGIIAFIKKPVQVFEIKEAFEFTLGQTLQNQILGMK